LSLSIRSAGPQQPVSAAPDAASPAPAADAPQPQGVPPAIATVAGAAQTLAKAASAIAGKPAAHRDPGTVWAVDVSPALGMTEAPPAAAAKPPMRVFQGASDVKEFKF
jgi:hypothetical protein